MCRDTSASQYRLPTVPREMIQCLNADMSILILRQQIEIERRRSDLEQRRFTADLYKLRGKHLRNMAEIAWLSAEIAAKPSYLPPAAGWWVPRVKRALVIGLACGLCFDAARAFLRR